MDTKTIVMCVVALLLGMLLFRMLKDVCGCKTVEGNGDEVGCCIAAPPCPGQDVSLQLYGARNCNVSAIRCIVSYLKNNYNYTNKTLQGFQEFLNSDNTIQMAAAEPAARLSYPIDILGLDQETGNFIYGVSPYDPADNTSILDFIINNICDSQYVVTYVDGVADPGYPYSSDNSLYGPEGHPTPTFRLSGPGPLICPNNDCEVKYIHIWNEAYTYLTNDYTGSELSSCGIPSCMD